MASQDWLFRLDWLPPTRQGKRTIRDELNRESPNEAIPVAAAEIDVQDEGGSRLMRSVRSRAKTRTSSCRLGPTKEYRRCS